MEEDSKLVRDHIPEIIREKGVVPKIHIADDEEYWQKLREKLDEEVAEWKRDESIEELADILEVIHTICEFKNIAPTDLQKAQTKKRTDHGSFSKRIILTLE